MEALHECVQSTKQVRQSSIDVVDEFTLAQSVLRVLVNKENASGGQQDETALVEELRVLEEITSNKEPL